MLFLMSELFCVEVFTTDDELAGAVGVNAANDWLCWFIDDDVDGLGLASGFGTGTG